jgi:uncharacterized protein (TIGR03083 family)
MTAAAIEGLRAEQARALDLIATLTPDEWAAASGCTGWRVQDVVQHMASVFHGIADPTTIERGESHDVEENAEVPVQARKDWSVDQVVAEYNEWSDKGIGALAGMQEAPMADMVVPIGNLGSHPLHILGNAIAFDHYCHLRHDIGAAVPRAADLPRDAAVLTATVEWMLAGLPQMCEGALAGCSQGVNLHFTDLGTTAAVVPPDGDGLWEVRDGATAGLPTASGSAHDFVSWATQRADWRATWTLDQANDAAAATLDAFNVI